MIIFLQACGNVGGIDLTTYTNIEAWFEKCVKLIPNYEKVNGDRVATFGDFYKSKMNSKEHVVEWLEFYLIKSLPLNLAKISEGL